MSNKTIIAITLCAAILAIGIGIVYAYLSDASEQQNTGKHAAVSNKSINTSNDNINAKKY